MAKTPPFSLCNEFCVGGGGASNAKDVKYDNTSSGLEANNVGGAIDEICTKMNDIDTAKDWNQNDPKKADYIKNRPFYEDGTKVKQLEEKFIPDNIARIADLDEFKIKVTANGELISLSDSAEKPLQSMKIYGKTEMIPIPTLHKNKFNNDPSLLKKIGYISASSGNYAERIGFDIRLPVGTYTLSAEDLSPVTTNRYLYGNISDENNYALRTCHISNGIEVTQKQTITINEGEHLFLYNGNSNLNVQATQELFSLFNIQIEEGTEATPYEPYMPCFSFENTGKSGSTTEHVIGNNLFNNDTSLIKELTPISQIQGAPVYGYEFDLEKGDYTITIQELSCNGSVLFETILDADNNVISRVELFGDYGNCTPYTVTLHEGDRLFIYDITGMNNLAFWESLSMQIENGNKSTPVKPYNEQKLTISTPNGLDGLGEYCDYIDLKKGVRVQRIGEYVFTGDEDANNVWLEGSGRYVWIDDKGYFSAVKGRTDNCICTHFLNVQLESLDENNVFFCVMSNESWTIETFKQFFKAQYDAGTPVRIRYALAEPIETPLTEEEIQAYKSLHTNYPNTTIYNSNGAGAEVEYVADTKNYIDNKIAVEVEKLTAAIITE